MAIAAAVGALSSLVSGVAAIQQASYQASIAEANARQARYNAEQAAEIAQRDAQDIGTENAGLLGEQLVGMGASGIELSSPSFVRSRRRAQSLAIEDQNRRIEAGNKEYANYQTQANMFDAEAKAHKSSRGLIALGAGLDAVGSLVGDSKPSGSSVNQFAKKQQVGATYFNRPTNRTATYLRGRYAY